MLHKANNWVLDMATSREHTGTLPVYQIIPFLLSHTDIEHLRQKKQKKKTYNHTEKQNIQSVFVCGRLLMCVVCQTAAKNELS